MAALGHLESKLAVLRPLIEADSTIEVAINGDGRVWVERAGDSAMSLADVTLSPVEVKDLAGLIANKQRLTLTDALPAISTTIDYAGATLRCQAIIPPASAGGTTITFRVFRRRLAGDAPKHFRFLRDQTVSLEAERLELLREVLDAGLPFFGICFGNQIFGRALGFDTYKLKFGHRGPNQPVLDKATGRVAITSQNHGFAVDAPLGEPIEAPESRFGRVEVSHWSLNDQVVEGLRLLDRPAFSVQFHPESAAGPNDTLDLFDRFVRMLTEHRDAAAPAATEGA